MDFKNFSFPILQEKVQVLDSHPYYRISDIILHLGPTWRLAASRILENVDQYGESLLYSYLSSNGIDSNVNIPLLNSILSSERFSDYYTKPRTTDLVLHLRLGDMLEPGHPIGPERITSYINNMLFYLKNLASKGQLDKFDRLVVCTAIVYGGFNGACDYSLISEVISRQLLSNVLFEAEKLGLFVDVKSSADVDSDMYFMWSAEHLALSNSRFSALIAECARAYKPTMIYPFAYSEFKRDMKGGKILYKKAELLAEENFYKID